MLNIAERRKELEMTQTELAGKLGVRQSTVSNWEIGIRQLKIQMLFKLSEIFDCTLDDLVSKDIKST